jgi:hypothetical protein
LIAVRLVVAVAVRVSANTSDVVPRPTTVKTRTTFGPTSESATSRTTVESHCLAIRQISPDFALALGSATATS